MRLLVWGRYMMKHDAAWRYMHTLELARGVLLSCITIRSNIYTLLFFPPIRAPYFFHLLSGYGFFFIIFSFLLGPCFNHSSHNLLFIGYKLGEAASSCTSKLLSASRESYNFTPFLFWVSEYKIKRHFKMHSLKCKSYILDWIFWNTKFYFKIYYILNCTI